MGNTAILNGVVTSYESDKYALHKHAMKLDEICRTTNQSSFLNLCDSTDLQFNLGNAELPDGVKSTNEIMLIKGIWIDAADAVRDIGVALAHIQLKKTRFGLVKNEYEEVVSEFKESMEYAQGAVATGTN